jgi:hypothetical protein
MMNEEKKCIKCNKVKPLTDYSFRKDTNKYRNICKECNSKQKKEWRDKNQEYIKQYRKDNKEHIKETTKKYYEKNAEHLKDYAKDYYNEHKDYYNEKSRKYKEQNKEYLKEYDKEYRNTHKEEILNQHREYIKNNREIVNKRRANYIKKRKQTDEFFKYKEQVRRLVIKSFTRRGYKKNSKTYEIVGCNYETLLIHLKETYKRNYGVEWDGKEKVHIDHIIPLATATDENDVKRLCNYKNLQLLKEKDNLEKRDKLDYKIKRED